VGSIHDDRQLAVIDDARTAMQDIATTLDSLLRIRYAEESGSALRATTVTNYLRSEIRRLRPASATAQTLTEVIETAAGLTSDQIASIRNRCLFYGCDDLIALLVHKRIRSDAIAREEAVLYIQDRLQRDDFRRICNFSADRGATFVTYMWQVVSNLLLDFLRAQGKRATEVVHDRMTSTENVSASDGIDPQSEVAAEATFESRQLHEMLTDLMAERGAGIGAQHPFREKLRPHLKLSSKEKLFLKAMFQYDMSINEIRALPGFEMSVNEAYRFYYRIIEQLLVSFKNAGLIDGLRVQVSSTAPRIEILVEGIEATIALTAIYYFEQLNRRSTGCHADWQGTVSVGVIGESFAKLSKRFAAFFTPISTTIAMSDRVLAGTREWLGDGVVRIAGIAKSFQIGKRQWAALKERFTTKVSS
jgi:hypothetical protein